MHKTVENLILIQNEIKSKIIELNLNDYKPKIVAISKTFKLDHILPLIDYGHLNFGENKVQEALEKWIDVKNKNFQIKLHMVGKLQTNKVKQALKIFDYIHSLDNIDSDIYFSKMRSLNDNIKLNELSMGMSHDYLTAIKYLSSYLRIGSKIFGARN